MIGKGMGLEFRVLGPLEVVAGETTLDVGGPKPRAVLALLALQANAVVSTDALVEALWGNDAPPTAVGVVRTYVYRLRQKLSADRDHARLTSRKPGYLLEVDPDQVDAHRFERLAGQGRRDLDAGRPGTALPVLDQALGLWRGDALADLAELRSLQPAASRLDQMRLTATEDRIDAELALGHHAEMVGDLETLTKEHPFRERLWRQLIVALYRSERQVDALTAYQTVRATLMDQLGVDPGPELRSLEQEVLTQAEALRWRPPTAAGPEGSTPALPAERDRTPVATVKVPSGDQPFVGRANERAMLTRAFDAAQAGTFSALFVTGPPGIGKTTLATRFARDAEAAGAAVVIGRADEGGGVPLQPLREVIHHWARRCDGDEVRLLGSIDAEHLGRVVPSLAERRDGVSSSSEISEIASPLGGADRQRLLEAIARWVEVLGASRTAVVVLEDLHWADAATVLAVRHLLRHPPPVGALLVVTLRDTEIDRGHDLSDVLTSARGDRHVHRIDLAGLADDDVVDLLRSEAGDQPGRAGRAFAVQLNHLTGGNPLFIYETLRHLTERGVISPDAGGWSGERPIEGFGVPAGVVDLIEQRLRRLPAPTAEVLRPAAVLGQHFDLPVLSRVADMSEIAVVEALEPALTARLVSQDGSGRPDRFEFSHTLVRPAIVDGLAPSQRARLHWQAGMILASLTEGHPEPPLAQVAHHLTAGIAAGDAHTAIVANVRAGQQALSSFAFEDACSLFTTATDVLDTGGITDADLAYIAWLGRGQAAGALGDGERQGSSFLRAATIAQRQGWPRRLARAATGFAAYATGNMTLTPPDDHRAASLTEEALAAADTPTVDRCLLLATKTMHAVSREQVDHALDLASAAVEMADALGDPTAVASALVARCWTLLGTPCPRELDETARRALALVARPEASVLLRQLVFPVLALPALQRGDQATLDAVSVVDADGAGSQPENGRWPHEVALRCTWNAAIALCRGQFDDAHRRIAAVTDTSDLPIWQAATNLQTAIASIEQGMHAEVEAMVTRLVSCTPEVVAPRAVLATLHAQAGDRIEAARQIEILRRHRPLDRLGWSAPLTLRHLAEIAARLDDRHLAGDVLSVLEGYSGQMLVSYSGTTIDGAADRAIGQLLLSLGRVDEAVERLATAEALERSVGADALATRTAYWHARARLDRDDAGDDAGDAEMARKLLHETSTRARQLGMTQLARDADEQLQR